MESGGVRAAVDKTLRSFDGLASPETTKSRAEYFGLAEHDRLAETILHRDGNNLAVGGIRFKNLDVNFPFVHVAANFPVTMGGITLFNRLAKERYASLPIRGITMKLGPDIFRDFPHEKWSHVLLGKTDVPQTEKIPEGLWVEFGGTNGFYADYVREYGEFLAEQPEKKPFLRLEEEEDLKGAAEAGLLLTVWDQMGWAGVVAARTKDFYGLPAIYIFEIFLAKRWRGRRAAGALQAEFLRRASAKHSQVFGHINHANQPSLRTALSQGRKVVETEYFFPLA